MKIEKGLFLLFIISVLTLFVSSFVSADYCGGSRPCHCGDYVVENHMMWYDLVDCPDDGLSVGGDITLDCNNHLIDGDGSGTFNKGIWIGEATVINCNIQEFQYGIFGDKSSHNNFLSNNNVSNNEEVGIYLGKMSDNNVLLDNIVSYNRGSGIVLASEADNNILSGNVVSNNDYGITIGSWSNDIYNNVFVNNGVNAYDSGSSNNWNISTAGNFWDDFPSNPGYPDYYEIPGSGNGIDWHPNRVKCGERIYKNTVLTNDLIDCPEHGLIMGADDIILDCNGHLIDGTSYGISSGIYLYYMNNVTIMNCDVQEFYRGIYFEHSSNSNIINNALNYNTNNGITLIGSNNILIGNTANYNNAAGLELTFSSNNNVSENEFNENNHGVYLYDSQYNTLWNNYFVDNGINAYENPSSNNNNWNLSNVGNYWSDFSSNPSYPNYYEILGEGNGIDWHPLGQIECGTTIIQDLILYNNLLNCQEHGLIIGANDITLNCNGHLIDGDSVGNQNYGIYLNNKNGVIVMNCNVTRFVSGSYLSFSANNTLTANTVNNNNYGIVLYSSFNNNLINNTANYTYQYGFYLEDSSNNNLIGNTANNNSINGIFLDSSFNNNITGNIVSSNRVNGIYLYGSSDNIIEYNSANHNEGIGISIYSQSNNNILSNNIASNNKNDGIRLFQSFNNTISNSVLSYNERGILLNGSNGNVIFDNVLSDNNGEGILSASSSHNSVFANQFSQSEYGIYFTSGENTGLWNNSFINNSIENAHEEGSLVNNYWNLSNVGNYWSDLFNNPGYPNYYEIPGPGNGIDWHPIPPEPPQCGDTIYENTILFHDLLNCSDHGLIIGADNITLNCDGHLIDGIPDPYSTGYGVKLRYRESVTVKNCNLQEFSDGIFLQESPNNTIIGNMMNNNVHYGIALHEWSDNNVIYNNYFVENNEYGAYLTVVSSHNYFWNNTFINNGLNAYENLGFNNWNLSDIGNYWSDFSSNPGYPYYYVISGPGYSIDWHPSFVEFYVDDSDSEFVVLSGTWNSRDHPNAYNDEALYNNPGFGLERAGWKVNNLVFPGTYEVYVWKFEHEYSNRMGTNVHYMVYHRTGTSNWILVNQSTSGNEWIYLGEFEFDNSHGQGILISDEANGFVIADAVKLVYTGSLNDAKSTGPDMFD